MSSLVCILITTFAKDAFCYGNEIRQFHAVRVAGLPAPVEDPNNESYTLGHYLSQHGQQQNQQQQAQSNAQDPPADHAFEVDVDLAKGPGDVSLRDALSHWDMYAPSKKKKKSSEDDNDDDYSSRYLIQHWRGGTICDETGLERSVEVQVCSILLLF